MKKKFVYLFIFIAVAVFQLSFLPVISDKETVANAVLMMILAWSVLDGFFAFLSWAIFFGIFYDIISYSTVGTHAFIFLAIVYFVSFFSRRFSMELRGVGMILFLLFIFVSTLASNAIIALTFAGKIGSLHGFWYSFGSPGVIIVELIYNTFFFIIFFVAIKKIKRFFMITN